MMSEGRKQIRWRTVQIYLAIWFVAIIVWTSPSYVECARKQQKQINAEQQLEIAPYFVLVFRRTFVTDARCTGAFSENNSDTIIALFTIILAISTILLWRETRRLAEGADEQAEKMRLSIREQRRTAFASIASARAARRAIKSARDVGEAQVRGYLSFKINDVVVDSLTEGAMPRCEVRITGKILNTGQTPTYGARMCYDIGVAAKHEVRGFSADGSDLFESKPAAYAIASQGDTKQSARKKLSVRSSDITSGKLILRFTYLIKYTDVFGEENITPICDGYFQSRQDGGLDFIAGQIERIES